MNPYRLLYNTLLSIKFDTMRTRPDLYEHSSFVYAINSVLVDLDTKATDFEHSIEFDEVVRRFSHLKFIKDTVELPTAKRERKQCLTCGTEMVDVLEQRKYCTRTCATKMRNVRYHERVHGKAV